MRVSLGPELERFVRNQVKTGQYATPDHVVRGALQALMDQENWIAAHADQLKQAIAVGLDELDRGEGEPWDAAEIKATARKLRAARAIKSRATKRKPR